MTKRFTRVTEDFVCEKCGRDVKGGGYTNHCPECLWSKHVDDNPGDRASLCGGLMEPVKVLHEKGKRILVHVCVRCGHTKRNKVAPDDNFETLISVTKRVAEMY